MIFLEASCAILEFCSFLVILLSIATRKSVQGLSCDFVILAGLNKLLGIGIACAYSASLISNLVNKRYPESPEQRISVFAAFIDSLSVLVLATINYQLHIAKRRTRSPHQVISKTLIFFLCSALALLLILTKNVIDKKATLTILDCVEFVWFLRVLIITFQFCPQITIQWFEMTSSGLPKAAFSFSCSKEIISAISNLISAQCSSPFCRHSPVSSVPFVTNIMVLGQLSLIFYQYHIYSWPLNMLHAKSAYEMR